ncbi:helix-turn-helix transcriptional regulator [Pseudenhygromyxa sp. WMMC2535]|uniref:helix-turn-helix domain-containing protein n=1 Tax=Pseudenhygromyxa sp. WMMC2535 TaxID=2712867 RepID=UPI001554A04F|nr:helix-turn-helix transcriptional regulator [Pseudenhygromyxa sp. WMMC2535]NVB38225.1 helix-turn-helix transcriptional regulator [Pseudenhygromyxa sp. WMMC2535]NVB41624.1 helix-turn-helix transcriptional regulator [Pseudenhygromyxa sp. WMMC2535]NVB43648.1 helix-turn-helix transcriptional regulator [Pseudenhygromyxa sp. WMMC2535]
MNTTDNEFRQDFGSHVRSLRKARNMTQEGLAESSGLSADTIRRLEKGNFSPSLDTLRKLSQGMTLSLSTLFAAFEFGELDPSRELQDLLRGLETQEVRQMLRVLQVLLDCLKG